MALGTERLVRDDGNLATIGMSHITTGNGHLGDREYLNQGPGKCNYIAEIW